jgi:DNA-directed RNA polymerase subunit RPC12/RpoP
MKTHNAFLYHCLNCGNVIHSERQERPPRCCDHEMVMAAAETIYDGEDAMPEETGSVPCEMADPAVKPR